MNCTNHAQRTVKNSKKKTGSKADALRSALAILAAQARDIKLDLEWKGIEVSQQVVECK